MKNVLVLGAGQSSPYLIHYLLEMPKSMIGLLLLLTGM